MNYRTNQNTDKERKDIFSILQSSLGFPKEGDILLSEVHKRVLNTISDIILLRKEDMSVVICASKLKLISSSERNESVRLSLGSNNSAAVLTVYRQQYTIRVDSKKGITLILGDRDLSETIIVNNLAPFVYDVECYIRYRNIELEEASVASLKNDLRIINDSLSSSFTNKELILSIPDLTDDRGWMDLVYAPFFAYSFECICRSVLSGEYAMDDGFSQKVRILAQKLRNSTLYEGPLNDEDSYLSSWLSYLSRCIVTLSQILDEYNLFCIQIDAQVDKEPSSILRKTEEYYDRHDYVNSLYDFMSINSEKGFLNVNPMLLHFFLSFLEMARIDQNFYFSSANFASLMYMRELLQDDEILEVNDTYQNKNTDEDATDSKNKDKRGKGLVQVWKKCEKDSLLYDFKGVQDVLELARLKNDILLRKMWEGCYEELKDLTYVGQDKVLIFDPRKCREKEVGEEYHTKLLLSDKLFDGGKKERVQEFLKMTKTLVDGSCFEETDKSFEGYEKEYIKSKWGDENAAMKATDGYYRNIMMSQTSHTSLDIRHYNSKVIEMSRDSVYYTADFRMWIKHHKYDYEESVAFPQIHKMLLFLQNRYPEGIVCYDSEMLEGYARWCIEFLKMVSKKTPEPDSNRPSQIEEALLLLETVNSLLDRLVVSIEKGNYCLPFASKFRGCFFKYNKQVKTIEEQVTATTHSASVGNVDNTDKVVSPILERVFVEGNQDDGYKKEDFEPFISAATSEEKWNGWGDDEQIEKRKDILFIASSFVPPFNLERLKSLKTKFKIDTHKLRNEIHADYFNRLREYVKEDSMKQLEENRRSVVQILGIFAAFLALTTVALGASTANHSNLPFMSIMIGFTTCIAIFVGVLFWLTRRNIRNSIEQQNKRDKINKNQLYEDVSSIVRDNIEQIAITEKAIDEEFNKIRQEMTKKFENLNNAYPARKKEIDESKKQLETQVSESEQKQKRNNQKVKCILNEIVKKIKEKRNSQQFIDKCKLWGPSILICLALFVNTILLWSKDYHEKETTTDNIDSIRTTEENVITLGQQKITVIQRP